MADSARERELWRIDQRLADLAAERQTLESARAAMCGRGVDQGPTRAALTQQATAREKVALFRFLFRGRTDAYPLRWENKSSDKSGYAPTCSNEWVRGALESLHRGSVSGKNGTKGIPLPNNDEDSGTPWALPAATNAPSPVTEPLPNRVIVTLADQGYIDRTALTASMVMRLMRPATFQNPEFYQAGERFALSQRRSASGIDSRQRVSSRASRDRSRAKSSRG